MRYLIGLNMKDGVPDQVRVLRMTAGYSYFLMPSSKSKANGTFRVPVNRQKTIEVPYAILIVSRNSTPVTRWGGLQGQAISFLLKVLELGGLMLDFLPARRPVTVLEAE